MGYDRGFCQRATAKPTHIMVHMQLIPLCGIWRLRIKQDLELPVATTALVCPMHLTNANGPQIHYLMVKSTSNHQTLSTTQAWNMDTRPGCSFANCAFKHICWYCSSDSRVLDKAHKDVFCSHQLRTCRKEEITASAIMTEYHVATYILINYKPSAHDCILRTSVIVNFRCVVKLKSL